MGDQFDRAENSETCMMTPIETRVAAADKSNISRYNWINLLIKYNL